MSVFTESGLPRITTILILGVAVLILSAQLFTSFIQPTLIKTYSNLPVGMKLWLRIFNKILLYISPIVFGIVAYHMWLQDRGSAPILIGIIILSQIRDIVNDEREGLVKS